MASAAQMIANKANAQHSTGPRTEAGKAAVSQNATKHGLTSKNFIIQPGREAEFTEFSDNLRAEFQPEGHYQDFLFRQLLLAAWNMERCSQAEAALHTGAATDPLLVQANAAQLKLLVLYRSRAERSFSQTVKELRHVQTEMFYRTETGLPEDISPVVETKAVVKQLVSERLRGNQADLAAIRVACEAPPPQAEPPAPPATPAPPQPRPATAADYPFARPAGQPSFFEQTKRVLGADRTNAILGMTDKAAA